MCGTMKSELITPQEQKSPGTDIVDQFARTAVAVIGEADDVVGGGHGHSCN